ncbi:hypothetical protein [Streptomyces sp. NBC_01445]|uniref:hypothetical protein n=1 Tax=Streptomyces sp. NBC_01445 TaxID=2903869 RepID=UPI002DD7BF04|nr:hypothetical protein [Streptomyces sp. NBC_01445]WSE11527.1 hypothetical protein OG574_51040 [Streptomyces sp. NBC_01445]
MTPEIEEGAASPAATSRTATRTATRTARGSSLRSSLPPMLFQLLDEFAAEQEVSKRAARDQVGAVPLRGIS